MKRWIEWLKEHKDWVFPAVGIVLTVIGGGWAAYLHFSSPPNAPVVAGSSGGIIAGGDVTATAGEGGVALVATGPVTVNQGATEVAELAEQAINSLTKRLEAQDRWLMAAETKEAEARAREEFLREQVEAGTETVRFLQKLEGSTDALKELAQGRTEAAEAVFSDIIARSEGAGVQGDRAAAEAARHLGNLAVERDKETAIQHYERSVQLDPDNSRAHEQLEALTRRSSKARTKTVASRAQLQAHTARAIETDSPGLPPDCSADCPDCDHLPESLLPDELVRLISQRLADALAWQDAPGCGVALVDQIVLPAFDLERASRWVLGKHWRQASALQRERFIREFRTLLTRTYASGIIDGEMGLFLPPEDMTFFPVELGKNSAEDATVRTQLPEGQDGVPRDASYRLHRTDGVWRIYDMHVEGVSLITTYRSSFNAELRERGVDGLIERIADKNEQ